MPSIGAIGRYLETPVCGWALVAFRIIFGFMLAADTVIERGWAEQDIYDQLRQSASERLCTFPLFDWMPKLTPEVFAIACAVQVFAALCISVGFLFRLSCFVFLTTFASCLMVDKLHWNNHSYLYCILVTLLMTTRANGRFSVDAIMFRSKEVTNVRLFQVPYWNYFVLQIQIAIVYTYAGINKINDDWIHGRSLPTVSHHWVFSGLRQMFPDQIDPSWFDFVVVRMSGIVIDSLCGIGFFFPATRLVSLIFTTAFHLMNSQMFNIGVFSGVMLASQSLFLPSYTLPPKWNQTSVVPKQPNKSKGKDKFLPTTTEAAEPRHYWLLILMGCHVLVQILMPQCHSLFPGLVTWSNTGQYGFSWEMMLHEWNVAQITVNLVDKENGEDLYLDSDKLVPMGSHRWAFHPDMVWQFSKCVRHMLEKVDEEESRTPVTDVADRFALYIDSWISLNQRVHQRFIDPNQDFFRASFSAFERPPWVLSLIEALPRLNGYSNTELFNALQLTSRIAPGDKSKVEYLVFADFPGNSLHHFIDPTLDYVQLFVLNGSVKVRFDDKASAPMLSLKTGDPPLMIPNGQFHTLVTISEIPSLCMYTFVNSTMWREIEEQERQSSKGNSNVQNDDTYSLFKYLTKKAVKLFNKAKQGVDISGRAFRSLALGETGL